MSDNIRNEGAELKATDLFLMSELDPSTLQTLDNVNAILSGIYGLLCNGDEIWEGITYAPSADFAEQTVSKEELDDLCTRLETIRARVINDIMDWKKADPIIKELIARTKEKGEEK